MTTTIQTESVYELFSRLHDENPDEEDSGLVIMAKEAILERCSTAREVVEFLTPLISYMVSARGRYKARQLEQSVLSVTTNPDGTLTVMTPDPAFLPPPDENDEPAQHKQRTSTATASTTAAPRRRRGRSRQRQRVRITVGGKNLRHPTVEQLRALLNTGVDWETFLSQPFRPGRGKLVAWGTASIEEHEARIAAQEGQAHSLLDDAARHRMAVEIIRGVPGATNLRDAFRILEAGRK